MNASTIAALRFRAAQNEHPRCVDCGRKTKHLRRRCGACAKRRAAQREYRERNRDRVAAAQREYYQRNRDRVAAAKREYYQRNRDRVAAAQRAAWRLAPPRCSACGCPLEYQGKGRPPVRCINHGGRARVLETADLEQVA